MGKHVCPVCETVYVQRDILEVEIKDELAEYEYWQCPSCHYQFISLADMKGIINRLNAVYPLSIKFQKPSKTVG